MSRSVTASLTLNGGGNTIRFPYSLDITPIFRSASVHGIVHVVNKSSQSVSCTAHLGLDIGVTLAGNATIPAGSTRSIPVTATLNASQAHSLARGAHVNNYYAYGNGCSAAGHSLQACIISLSFTIPTAGDPIAHSSLSQFVNFLTLYGTSHTTNNTILSASESSYPQGRYGGYSIVTSGGTTSSYSGFSAGTVVSISYVDNPYDAYKARSFHS